MRYVTALPSTTRLGIVSILYCSLLCKNLQRASLYKCKADKDEDIELIMWMLAFVEQG